ncbi:hypothetical protein EDB81DRAFT_793780 [Dactylonectria macrodidyma]|uniref:Uncharacterized protein n=1 Tax=Dactylonectria macrodidyma TaxID=307937 RepID=A0A9P9J5G8_9HYPO|nr:hypothetical protein EDB81DRAFT_793780 [Dactylonectria macrodidyma]
MADYHAPSDPPKLPECPVTNCFRPLIQTASAHNSNPQCTPLAWKVPFRQSARHVEVEVDTPRTLNVQCVLQRILSTATPSSIIARNRSSPTSVPVSQGDTAAPWPDIAMFVSIDRLCREGIDTPEYDSVQNTGSCIQCTPWIVFLLTNTRLSACLCRASVTVSGYRSFRSSFPTSLPSWSCDIRVCQILPGPGSQASADPADAGGGRQAAWMANNSMSLCAYESI